MSTLIKRRIQVKPTGKIRETYEQGTTDEQAANEKGITKRIKKTKKSQ